MLGGVLFGAMTVLVRWALVRGADPIVGGAVVTTTAAMLSAALALPSLLDRASLGELWGFAVVGAVVPGISQALFIFAVDSAGPSRAAIVVGTAPLLSIGIALAILNEAFEPALLIATILVVAGGAALATERSRPPDFRVIGILLAFSCAFLFALRDNAVRWLARDAAVAPLVATAVTLCTAAVVMVVYALVARRGVVRAVLPATIRAFLPAGIVLALAYAALVTAFDRGRVSVVAQLNATQSLWGLVFAALVFGRAEAIGRRTVLAGALIVAGSAIVGAVR